MSSVIVVQGVETGPPPAEANAYLNRQRVCLSLSVAMEVPIVFCVFVSVAVAIAVAGKLLFCVSRSVRKGYVVSPETDSWWLGDWSLEPDSARLELSPRLIIRPRELFHINFDTGTRLCYDITQIDKGSLWLETGDSLRRIERWNEGLRIAWQESEGESNWAYYSPTNL